MLFSLCSLPYSRIEFWISYCMLSTGFKKLTVLKSLRNLKEPTVLYCIYVKSEEIYFTMLWMAALLGVDFSKLY